MISKKHCPSLGPTFFKPNDRCPASHDVMIGQPRTDSNHVHQADKNYIFKSKTGETFFAQIDKGHS